MLIQTYGIHPWGDFLGGLGLLGLYGFLSACGAPGVIKKWFWIVAFAFSGWGSLTVLPRALYRMDPATFAYHTAWLVLMSWAVYKIWTPPWDETLLRLDAWRARTAVRVIDLFDRKGGEHERL